MTQSADNTGRASFWTTCCLNSLSQDLGFSLVLFIFLSLACRLTLELPFFQYRHLDTSIITSTLPLALPIECRSFALVNGLLQNVST